MHFFHTLCRRPRPPSSAIPAVVDRGERARRRGPRTVGLVALAATAFFAPAAAHAQDLARVSYQYRAPASVEDTSDGGDGVELTTHAVTGAFLTPVPVAPRFILLAGAQYEWFRTSAELAGISQEDDLHEVGISVGGRFRINQQWTALALVSPSLASDFEDLGSDAINLRAVLRADVRLSEPVSLSFGVAASYVLGTLLPLPVLGLDWTPGPADRLTVLLPSGVRYAHLFGDRVDVGASVRLRGTRYAVDRGPVDTVSTAAVDAGAEVGVRLAGPLWLEVFGGVTVFRIFEVSDGDDDGLFDSRVDPGFTLETALVVRLPHRPEAHPEPQPREAGTSQEEAPR